MVHLAEMFGYLEEHAASVEDKPAVSLAIFFHDAVYSARAGSPKNERDSAVLFDRFGQEALPAGDPVGLAKGELIQKVKRWIQMTASHKVGEDEEDDCKLFMDFDMAVLGKPWEQYFQYARQIRAEYQHVGEALYCKARAHFLVATAAGPPVFATEVFRTRFEERARANMGKEASFLQETFKHRCSLPAQWCATLALGMKRMSSSPVSLAVGVVAIGASAAAAPKMAACVAVGVAVGATLFGLRLAFGSKYVRHPYPQPAEPRPDTVVLAGSYNPPHLGHLAMLRYLSHAHRRVIAVVGVNPSKKYLISPYQRQELLRMMLREVNVGNVEVVVWDALIWQYAQSVRASTMYRGIRSWAEDGRAEKFLEFQNLLFQVVLGGRLPIPTAFLQGDPQYASVSSTLLRKRLSEGAAIDDLVTPGCVAQVSMASMASKTS